MGEQRALFGRGRGPAGGSASWRVYSGGSPAPGGSAHHILLHPHRPRWVVLNDTGLAIARLLSEGATVEAAATDLSSRYGIPIERAAADVSAVSDRLLREGFLGVDAERPAERSPAVQSLFVHLTTRCNLSCPHCYIHSPGIRASGPQDLPANVVVGLLDDLAGLGGRAVTLSGGEPLLHQELRRILHHAAARGLGIRLLTNGTLLDRAWAEFLAPFPVTVQVSLDGSCQEIHDAVRGPGGFQGALRAIEALQQAGLRERINLCATVMRSNVEDLEAIVRLAERLEVPLVRFLPLRRKGMADAAWESVGAGFGSGEHERFYGRIAERQREGRAAVSVSCGLSGFVLKLPREAAEDEIWCPVGRKIDIDVNGDAYPCVLMMEERFRLGNVHRETLASMIRSDAMRQVCRSLAGRRSTIERCATCLWSNLCQAGCMGQALDHAGTIEAVDDFCSYRRKAYEETFDRILALEAAGER